MSGIPPFVHREADPLIEEIRHYHDMYGMYPPGGGRRDAGETPEAMRPYLDQQAWCFYVSEEDDCRVDCHSIGFNHAVYRFSTNTWWVGD